MDLFDDKSKPTPTEILVALLTRDYGLGPAQIISLLGVHRTTVERALKADCTDVVRQCTMMSVHAQECAPAHANGAPRNGTTHYTKNIIKKEKAKPWSSVDDLFGQFWDAYGYKVKRKLALKEWHKLTPEQRRQAIEGIANYDECRKRDAKFTVAKCYPDQYLKHHRWTDEKSPVDSAGKSIFAR